MAQPTKSYFTTLTRLAQNLLDEVSLHRLDLNPERALSEMYGSFKQHGERKMTLQLTEEITVKMFLDYLEKINN